MDQIGKYCAVCTKLCYISSDYNNDLCENLRLHLCSDCSYRFGYNYLNKKIYIRQITTHGDEVPDYRIRECDHCNNRIAYPFGYFKLDEVVIGTNRIPFYCDWHLVAYSDSFDAMTVCMDNLPNHTIYSLIM